MAIKPTSNPTNWATDTTGAALKIETSDYHKQYGWGIISGVPEVPNLNEVNYWRFSVHQWLQYLDLAGEERDTDIATVNSRIDDLSSDQVSYEYSNDDVGNIYSVPLATFTEFDGTASTQYTDDGTLTTIANTTNAKNTGVLSVTNPNNTNDVLVSSLADSYAWTDQVELSFKKTAMYNAPKTSGIFDNGNFKKRFKYSLENDASGIWYLKVSKYNPSTGNFDAPFTAWSGNKDTKKYVNNVITSEDHIGCVFIGAGSLSATYYYVFYNVQTQTLFEGAVPVFSTATSGDTLTFSRLTVNYRSRSWIIYPEIGGVIKPTFLFETNWEPEEESFSGDGTYAQISMVNDLGHDWLRFPRMSLGNIEGYFPFYTTDYPPLDMDVGEAYDYGIDLSLDPNDNSKLLMRTLSAYGRVIAVGEYDTKFHFTSDWCDLDVASPSFNSISYGSVVEFNNTNRVVQDPNDFITAFPATGVWNGASNCLKTIWSDYDPVEKTGLTLIGLQAEIDNTGTQVSGIFGDNIYIMAPVEDENSSQLQCVFSGKIFPPTVFSVGVTSAVCGISSIDLLKKSGNTYTFTLGFKQGGSDVDSATEYTLSTDYTWDGTTFAQVASSTVTTSTLTANEIAKWKLDTDTQNYSNLTARVTNWDGVKRIDFEGFQQGQAPMYQAEVYQDGYFVYFKSNEAVIYGAGGSQPPGKPSWGGTARCIYFANSPSAGQDTLFTSSLNNTITGMIDGVSTGVAVSPQGILNMVDTQTYAYTMCSFIPAIDMPSGLSVQFTSVDFLQYDAFIPGLGNVQAALDNLYTQIGTVTSMEAFGGTEVNTTFDNHVLSLVTPRRYTSTGISLTSGVATTITHNLDQQIVQIAVYDESNDQKVDVDVTLVDANSLTITASSTITVSVVVLR